MALVDSALADAIRIQMGFPSPTSVQLQGWASGVLSELKAASAQFGSSQSGNTISGMAGASMASKVASGAGYPSVSSELRGFCSGIVSHIQGSGSVTYTGTPDGPTKWALGGTISGLSGSAMASQVASDMGLPGVSSKLSSMCGAIADYITANAQVQFGVIT